MRVISIVWIIKLLSIFSQIDSSKAEESDVIPADVDERLAVGSEESDDKQNKDSFVAKYDEVKGPALKLAGFDTCDQTECSQVCGTVNIKKGFCEAKNKKLCMCAMKHFMSSNVEGTISPVNREDDLEKECSFACNLRNSYARIWRPTEESKRCICLVNQVTSTGITLCDEFALKDLCQSVCQSESAVCTFNGVCLCRETWTSAFHLKLSNVRKEVDKDKQECNKRCAAYHSEFVGRIYDTKMKVHGSSKKYEFRDKYCLCGEEVEAESANIMKELQEQGFQACTDLKCKVRCGMNMLAKCEPKLRRACICPKPNIFIGKFLWARIPSKQEPACIFACKAYGLTPRVIEWNPFFKPELDTLSGFYRTSRFPYLYDGKFCHCINIKKEPNVNQFRPCTDELCQWLCGHVGATCDPKTRRVCLCRTHQMLAGLGRKPDPAENSCNVICRRNLNDARILDVNWDISPPSWTVERSKFCGCIRPVSASGLTHCEGMEGHDVCPKLCNNTQAYCTEQKVCECSANLNLLDNPLIRLPTGKEAEECGEICQSWSWPVVEDSDSKPFIYDESRSECASNNSCSSVDTAPWSLEQPGALKLQMDAMEQNPDSPKRYCLCAKSNDVMLSPGTQFLSQMEPPRLPKHLQCINSYVCRAVANKLHVVG